MRSNVLNWIVAGLAAALLQPVSALAHDGELAMQAEARACPGGLDAVASCYAGQDHNGAFYLAAIPKDWNQILVVHAHGGPRLGTPEAGDSDDDLERFAITVQQGYAWIGSTYRRGGYGVRMAAADVDNSRAVFWQQFGKPRLTILHGQSYGGNVAAKLAELGAVDPGGDRLFDGVLLTNGVLWGGTPAYGFRADLRAVYQYYCRNHPRADEPQYPIWQGLPRESDMTRRELGARYNACTGQNLAREARTAHQSARLAAISNITGIAEDQLLRHLEWATFHFRDLVHERLDGRNPFDNSQTIYRGSSDDGALNEGVERYSADPIAVATLAYDADLTGLILLPTIAVHWENDPVVSADADKFYEAKIAAAGRADLFVRLVAHGGTHSRLPDADLMGALQRLVSWIEATGSSGQTR